ncbi:MAG: hypothetical protein ACPL7B_02885, partial [Candidatus Poribacteria bacterium]
YILCETLEERLKLKENLSEYENPDLTDFLDILTNIYTKHKLGSLKIYYHINNGESNIQPKEPLYLYEQIFAEGNKIYKLIDLVLEIQPYPFYMLTKKEKKSLISEFRLIFVLYVIDKYGCLFNLNLLKPRNKKRIDRIINKLSLENLIDNLDDSWQNVSISYKGRELLDRLIDEAEYYIENYDIFGDVFVKGTDNILFNTGYGDNLIPTVLLHDGINPYRAIFLSALYIGNLDEIAFDMNKLFSDEIFNSLFEFICYSPTEEELGLKVFSNILIKGKEKVYENHLLEEKAKFIDRINNQIDQI